MSDTGDAFRLGVDQAGNRDGTELTNAGVQNRVRRRIKEWSRLGYSVLLPSPQGGGEHIVRVQRIALILASGFEFLTSDGSRPHKGGR